MRAVNSAPAWDAALCFAIMGARFDDLGVQTAPNPDRVRKVLVDRIPGGEQAIRDHVARRRDAGQPWPYPLPEELGAGIGYAQWSAAVGTLRRRLGLDRRAHRVVRSDVSVDSDDLRLMRERPPHHGAG